MRNFEWSWKLTVLLLGVWGCLGQPVGILETAISIISDGRAQEGLHQTDGRGCLIITSHLCANLPGATSSHFTNDAADKPRLFGKALSHPAGIISPEGKRTHSRNRHGLFTLLVYCDLSISIIFKYLQRHPQDFHWIHWMLNWTSLSFLTYLDMKVATKTYLDHLPTASAKHHIPRDQLKCRRGQEAAPHWFGKPHGGSWFQGSTCFNKSPLVQKYIKICCQLMTIMYYRIIIPRYPK